MGRYIANINANATDNATFQTWVQAVEAVITGAGLTVTSDTGQIDPTTVAWPGTNATDAGYRIYKLNDSLDATLKMWLKATYGRGTSPTPRVTFQICNGTNGAGTPTNPGNSYVCGASGTRVNAGCADTGLGAFWLRINGGFIAAERFYDVGDPETGMNADGYKELGAGNVSSNLSARSFDATNLVSTLNNGAWGAPVSVTASQTLTKASTLRVGQMYGWDFLNNELVKWRTVYGRAQVDFAEPVSFEWAPWGTTHEWLPIGLTANGPTALSDYSGGAGAKLLCLWDA